MTWVHVPSFATGEISPGLYGRIGSPQLETGLATLENATVTRTGGVRKRDGFLSQVDILGNLVTTPGNYKARIFSLRIDGDTYLLEVSSNDSGSDRFIRVLQSTSDSQLRMVAIGDGAAHGAVPAMGGGLPSPFSSPTQGYRHLYTEAQLDELQVFQHERRVYLVQSDHPPYYLEPSTRPTTGTNGAWEYGVAPLVDGSPEVVSHRIPVAIFLDKPPSLASVLESSEDFWRPGHAGGFIQLGSVGSGDHAQWWHLQEYLSPTRMRADPTVGGASAQFHGKETREVAGPWVYEGDSLTVTDLGQNVSSSTDIGTIVAITSASLDESYVGKLLRIFDASTGDGVFEVRSVSGSVAQGYFVRKNSPSLFTSTSYTAWVLEVPAEYNPGLSTITPDDVGPPNSTVNLRFSNPKSISDSFATTFDKFRNTDVGATIFLNGGAVRITSAVDDYTLQGVISSQLDHISAAAQWGVGWNGDTGFPSCGTSHQGRVYFGGFGGKQELTLVASRTYSPDDFSQGTGDASGLNYTIDEPGGGRINWMVSGKSLLIGTTHGEFIAEGEPLSPSEVSISRQTTYGSREGKEAIYVGGAAIFIGPQADELREMAFVFERDQFLAADLTATADHLFDPTTYTIDRIVHATTPETTIYAVAGDKLFSLTYERGSEVVGWSRWETSGNVEDAAVGRNQGLTGGDQLWIVRNRSGVRTIERSFPSVYMDATVLGNALTSTTADGFDALEGATVQVLADGIYLGTATVTSGAISFPDAGGTPTTVYAGLSFTTTVRPMIPEFTQGARGSTLGRRKNVNRAHLLLRDTRGGTFGGRSLQTVPNATPSTAIPALNDWNTVHGIGEHGSLPPVDFVSAVPYGFEINGLSMEVDYGD